MRRILFDEAPADGGNNSPAANSTPAATTAPSAAPVAAPSQPPPAAAVVVNGKTEREILLETQLATEREDKRRTEFKAADLERQLQEQRERQTNQPAPSQKKLQRAVPTVIGSSDEDETEEG